MGKLNGQHHGIVRELRALGIPMPYGKPCVVAGWYTDFEKMANDAVVLEDRQATGVYFTLNAVNPAFLARANNRTEDYAKPTTGDGDIIQRLWLPFDVDPVRPTGISSSAKELQLAWERAKMLRSWIKKNLGSYPEISAFSGNGFHHLCAIALPNDAESNDYVRDVINEAADLLDDEHVHVDRNVFNAARIWKLPGTLARKGDEVPEQGRLHRRSRLIVSREWRKDRWDE